MDSPIRFTKLFLLLVSSFFLKKKPKRILSFAEKERERERGGGEGGVEECVALDAGALLLV